MKGTQVSYGKFNSQGEIYDDITLNSFGDVNQVRSLCTNFYIGKDDYLSSVVYRYNEEGVQQLWLTTINGKSSSFGRASEDDASIVEQYDYDNVMFYGFFGVVEQQAGEQRYLRQLGLIVYDYVCLRDEKYRLGANFRWGNEVDIGEGDGVVVPTDEVDNPTGEVIDENTDQEAVTDD